MRSAERRARPASTLREVLRKAARRLESARVSFGHGTTNARDEAAWLALHALALPFESLETHLDRALTPGETDRIAALVDERIRTRKPAAYLTREAWLGEHRASNGRLFQQLREIRGLNYGNYAYIDSIEEAHKVFVEQGGALVCVAKDVKFQVEFNSATVSEYRLVGYETRALRNEAFNNDAIDAGDSGAGHAVPTGGARSHPAACGPRRSPQRAQSSTTGSSTRPTAW